MTYPTGDESHERRRRWKEIFRAQLPALGHRNWIAVTDGAYPWQIAPGIETICAEGEGLSILGQVLTCLDRCTHVKAVILTDAELPAVSEKDAPGITEYRAGLKKILAERQNESLPHARIIHALDEAAATFKVLVVKTSLALPYTSVFLRLECGYWSDTKEKRLRQSMNHSTRGRKKR